NLDTGNYVISEEVQNGWIQTYPIGSTYSIRIDVSSTIITSQNFGNFRYGSISGTKFNDLNGNSVKDAGDTILSGWKIRLNGAKIDSVLTDGSGNYTFSNLGPGNYTLNEELQTGWIQTLGQPGVITMTSGAAVTGKNFGNFQKVSISGQKFHDLDGDGVKDAEDIGLIDWTIRLSGTATASTTTDANGNYTFSDLGPGSYTLSEDMQTGWMQTKAPTGSIVTSSGTNVVNKDFGNFQLASISGKKYTDMAADSSIAGDNTLNNWVIKLYKSGVLQSRILTGEFGDYSFNNLTPGTYTVEESLETSWMQTYPQLSTPGVVLTTFGTNAGKRAYQVTVSSGINSNYRDFGNYQMATISGMKFNDLNGDSVKDAGDIGLSGWKIKITGTKTDSATTDANGNYTISNLPKGSYTLTEILQTGWKQTYPSGNSYNVTVGASGTVITGKDFGNFKLGIISGMKFNDLDGDGLKEAGESGLSGWIMWITGTKNDSVITDAGGNYSFNNLDIGNYTVTEEIKPGWLLTYPPGASYNIAIDASGINASGKDFGNFQLPTISGKKFHDHNGNGIKDPEDEGLIGWKIYLSGPRIDSAITDSYGDYTFVGLTPGKYLVRESIQDGWVQTTPNPDSITVTSNGSVTGINFGNFQKINISGRKFHDLNGNGVKDSGEPGLTGWGIKLGGAKTDSKTSDVNGDFIFTDLGPGKYAVTEQIQLGWVQTLHVDSFTVRSGENVLGKDIGNFQTISISGKKFHDFNGNGIIDGADTTVSGWHIQLTGSNRHDTVITNALGEYSFNNVGPGSFTISEEEKPGWLQAFPSGAGVYNLNVNASGQNISDKNFGNIFVGGLSGRKFQDKNGNGIEELDEPGLEGWVIVLNGPVGTRKDTTNSMGYYSFTNLPVGAYTISEEEQTGWIQTKPPQTSPEYHINLISGQHIDTLNFGNFSQGIVEGYKFNDTDGDGIKETGDSLMAGWNISLLRDGNVIGSTVTDVNGKYKFTGVAAGLYSVGEESKNGWIQLFPPTGLHRDTMIVGGYHPNKNFGNFETGTLRGQKFKDINGNHTRDAGEPVLQNWWIKISGPKTDSVLTDVNGSYSFTNLGPGTYTLTEKLQIGWMQTYPVSGSHIVTMTSGKIVTGLDFGNFERSSISGIKYFDKNANGTLDQSDTRLANFRIYLRGDNPANNAETLTDAQGNYTFPSLAVDSFTVYEESKQGWVTIAPTSGYYRVFLQSGEQRTNLNFGNYTDTVMYRTFSQTHFTEKPLRLKRRGPVPMPTGGNFCDATAKASTWAGGGFILGVASPESSKTNGWIRIHPNHVRAIFSYLTRRYFPVTGTAAGFDILNGRVYRSNHSISAIKNQNNHLAAEQLVLKFNIAASDLNITPKGFGNLIYYDSLNPGNPCQNKTLYRIREFTDSALTFWRQYSGTPGFFNQLDTCISRINRAFLGTIDTISTNPLRFTGVRSISGIGYLKPNPFPSVSDPAPIVEIDNGLPVEYALYQNYPNPFNPSTTIEFELPIPGRVTLKIYNVLGQEVAQLFNNEDMDEGRMQIAFDASLLASGVYFYRLTVENIDEEEIRNSTFVDTKKMILVK
ncbi:MAG: T9SS type A sorting domain-containing protein, partial [Ignavibacteriales bacterium]|nr:T9SS type A sorting domain-containing protein [Ignavibacteriales bacterium]